MTGDTEPGGRGPAGGPFGPPTANPYQPPTTVAPLAPRAPSPTPGSSGTLRLVVIASVGIFLAVGLVALVLRLTTKPLDDTTDTKAADRCIAQVKRARTAVHSGDLPSPLRSSGYWYQGSKEQPILQIRPIAPPACITYARSLDDELVVLPPASSGSAKDLDACMVEARTLETSTSYYRFTTGAYPSSVDDLTRNKEYLARTPTFVALATDGSGKLVLRDGAPDHCI